MPSTAASTMKRGVLDVHAGDHARQLAARRAALDQREQRHHEEAGEQADAGQVHDDAPAARLLQEAGDVEPGHRRRAAAREVQVEQERADAERAQRHQADFDRARRQLLAQQRTDAGADREQRQREDVQRRRRRRG